MNPPMTNAPAQAVHAVAVKPLEWEDGYAFVEPWPGHYRLYYAPGARHWSLGGHGFPNCPRANFATEQEGKAAAQADYEARIRSALYASPAPAPEAPAGTLDGSDIQLLMRLKFDNHEHGARPVIEGRQEDWDRAMRLSDLGYIAIEQVALGGRLHITRLGVKALGALATQADAPKGDA